ncbi:hypothetical protein ACWC24_14140 [Streptomyces sp. NPDC001443]
MCLDDFEAADELTEEKFWHAIEIEQYMLTTLAEHHSADGARSFYVLHNGAVTWGVPGEPQIVALHLERDLKRKTFRFEHAALPLPAMAQSWLIHRGCPRDAIGLRPGMGTRPADDATHALEQRLMDDGDHFALVHSHTQDDPDDMTTLVVLHVLDVCDPAPFRVLHEEVDTDALTHTLREGGFATAEEAFQWCDNRLNGEAAPLPPVRLEALLARRPGPVPAPPMKRPPRRNR